MTMGNDKMVSLEEVRVGLTKAKEAIKRQPGLMKSSVGWPGDHFKRRTQHGCRWN